MDFELIAFALAFAAALTPLAIAFRARAVRVGLALTWLVAVGAFIAEVPLYRTAHTPEETRDRPVERLRDDYVGSKECVAHPQDISGDLVRPSRLLCIPRSSTVGRVEWDAFPFNQGRQHGYCGPYRIPCFYVRYDRFVLRGTQHGDRESELHVFMFDEKKQPGAMLLKIKAFEKCLSAIFEKNDPPEATRAQAPDFFEKNR